jgi:hypothetical protein
MKRRSILIALSILIMVSLMLPGAALARKARPNTPIQESPLDGATNLSLPVTVRWTISNPGEIYRVQIASSPDFSPGSLITDAQVQDATGYTELSLVKGMTYYWHLNVTYYRFHSDWTPTWSFTTTTLAPPPAPTLVSPANGSGPYPWNQGMTFVWNPVEGADTYEIEGGSNFGSPWVRMTGLTGTTYTIANLDPYSPTFYWHIRARSVGGAGEWSETWSFSVDLSP